MTCLHSLACSRYVTSTFQFLLRWSLSSLSCAQMPRMNHQRRCTKISPRRSEYCAIYSIHKCIHTYKTFLTVRRDRQFSNMGNSLLLQELEVALNAYVSALRQDGWFSFPTAKTLLALAVGSRHQELSIKFIKYCVYLVVVVVVSVHDS